MHYSMDLCNPYNDIFQDEIMVTMNPALLLLTSSSPESILSSDNEEAVDLIRFLDSESDNVQEEIILPEQDNSMNNMFSPEQDNAMNGIMLPEQDNAMNSMFSPEQDNAMNSMFSPEQDNAMNSMFSPEQDNAMNSIISPEQDNAMNSIISSEQDNAMNNIIFPEQDNSMDNFLLSPLPAGRYTHDDVVYRPTFTTLNTGMMSMLSRSFADPHWLISPDRSSWVNSIVSPETEMPTSPLMPPSPPKFNALNPDQHISGEPATYLTAEDLEYLYGSEASSEEQPEEKKTKSDNVSGDESVDSYVDVEFVDSQDVPMCTVMFEEKSPVAKTSTQSQKKLLFAARAVRTPKPVGRPRGSKKKTPVAAAATGQASTSKFTVQPSCSTSNTETASASRCVSAVGQKRKFKCETVTSAPALPAYSPVLGNSFSMNFHDYAMSPLTPAFPSSASSSSVASTMPVAPTRRPYRRNASLDVVDKDKQNHHNQLERNRRQKLADLFTDLRVAVPKIESNPKASKVLILNEAASHINYLKHTQMLQGAEIFREEQKQRLLTNQLQQLRAKLSSRLK